MEISMNHKDKIIVAIRNQRDRAEQLTNAIAELAAAQINLDAAYKDVSRQIKNVIGVGKPVLYDGMIYLIDDSGELNVSVSEIEILTPTKL